jgi:hypothetical protein
MRSWSQSLMKEISEILLQDKRDPTELSHFLFFHVRIQGDGGHLPHGRGPHQNPVMLAP